MYSKLFPLFLSLSFLSLFSFSFSLFPFLSFFITLHQHEIKAVRGSWVMVVEAFNSETLK